MPDFNVPTHEITTPNKHKVVLKSYITGYDDEAIEAIYMRGEHRVTPIAPNATPEEKEAAEKANQMVLDGSAIQDAEREGIKRVVLSVDGNNGEGQTNGILDVVYQLRKEDTKAIKHAVSAVVNPEESTPEKKGVSKTK